MPKKPLDDEKLRQQYLRICPQCEKLGTNLKQALTDFLDEQDIDVLNVDYRVKSFESFRDTAERKGYKRPLKEMEDICGLRIVCFYPSDLEKISEIIEKEFEVVESVDKADLLEPEQFGYRSIHFIVRVKKDWLKAPNYRGLGDLRTEIQVRTILMHAWAAVQHKLAYKKKEHIPYELQRKSYQLSALFEIADQQFETLRQEKERYVTSLTSKPTRRREVFDLRQRMNVDSLEAFLDFCFADREKDMDDISVLLDQLLDDAVSFEQIENGYKKVKHILPDAETEMLENESPHRWSQGGIVRMILDLTHDNWWAKRQAMLHKVSRSTTWEKTVTKWRGKLSDK